MKHVPIRLFVIAIATVLLCVPALSGDTDKRTKEIEKWFSAPPESIKEVQLNFNKALNKVMPRVSCEDCEKFLVTSEYPYAIVYNGVLFVPPFEVFYNDSRQFLSVDGIKIPTGRDYVTFSLFPQPNRPPLVAVPTQDVEESSLEFLDVKFQEIVSRNYSKHKSDFENNPIVLFEGLKDKEKIRIMEIENMWLDEEQSNCLDKYHVEHRSLNFRTEDVKCCFFTVYLGDTDSVKRLKPCLQRAKQKRDKRLQRNVYERTKRYIMNEESKSNIPSVSFNITGRRYTGFPDKDLRCIKKLMSLDEFRLKKNLLGKSIAMELSNTCTDLKIEEIMSFLMNNTIATKQ